MIICEFRCKNNSCHRTIAVSGHTLLQEFEHREIQPMGIPLVALVCNHCKTVESYSEVDLVGSVTGAIDPKWEVVEPLLCVAKNCQFPLQLFAMWSEAISPEDRSVDVRVWRWRHLSCEAGHVVQKPAELIGYRL
jgi:hypothetical protein